MIHSYFPNFYEDRAVAHSFGSIVNCLSVDGKPSSKYVYANGGFPDPSITAAVPRLGFRYSSRFPHVLDRLLKAKVLRRVSRGDWVYLWMDTDLLWAQHLRSKGVRLAKEMINCPLVVRNRQLERAYKAIGESVPFVPTADLMREEIQHASQMDLVFCSNNQVMAAMIESGVPAGNCFLTSYGWSPARLKGDSTLFAQVDRKFTLLFCGTLDVRKGAAVLLSAWQKAEIDGQLVIAGQVDPLIIRKFGNVLARDDVVCLGHVSEIGSVYRSADAFVLPTWEEGGPMVTIEAMSQGLPCIVTPMGTAGAFEASDGVGIVIDYGDVDQLVTAIRFLANSPDDRLRMGKAASVVASRFTWERVAEQRAHAFLSR